MGRAIQVITGRATNPSSITALTANTGDSFTVRNATLGSNVWLDQMWGFNATAGIVRLRSPLMHDNVQGVRLRTKASDATPELPEYLRQKLFPQDALTFEQQGGGAETDAASILVYYEDLPGVDARLATWDQISGRIVHISAVESNLTSGGTAGQYGGSQAINANFDNFIANRDYAILGYLTDTAAVTIGWTAAEFGNLRIGAPATVKGEITSGWFVDLSRRLGLPYIPIFNSANKASVLVDLAMIATATAVNVTTICALLAQ